MKLLLLAAGRGTRISRYLNGQPKCLVDIGNTSLIEYTINLFKKNNITDIGICLGYKENLIREKLRNENIKFYLNPFYDVTNSIASLWFAKDFIKGREDVLIMNGDVFLEQKTLDLILDETRSPVLFSDESRKEEADYKFYYEKEILIKYGKALSLEETTGEYVGIAKLKGEFLTEFLKRLEKKIMTQCHGEWWEDILYSMVDEKDIYIKPVTGNFWAEVDYIEDYERIIEFMKNKGE